MLISDDYLEKCRENVLKNFENKPYVVGPLHYQGRVKRLLEFINSHALAGAKVLDIGSGGYMPNILGVTHACDIVEISGELLKKSGWGGEFRVASCDDLTYLDKSFDVAVCSEVIEHLPEVEDIKRTFMEIERVAKKWVVTTPKASKSGVRDSWNIEPDHKQFFSWKDMELMMLKMFPGLYGSGAIRLEEVEHYVFITRV